MERAFKIGCKVIFFDSLRNKHEALVTNWFHSGPDGQTWAEYEKEFKDKGYHPIYTPCCNLLWVSSDKSKEDPYGRQVERATSVSYGREVGMIPFIGMCWAWPDEEDEATDLAAKSYPEAVAK